MVIMVNVMVNMVNVKLSSLDILAFDLDDVLSHDGILYLFGDSYTSKVHRYLVNKMLNF